MAKRDDKTTTSGHTGPSLQLPAPYSQLLQWESQNPRSFHQERTPESTKCACNPKEPANRHLAFPPWCSLANTGLLTAEKGAMAALSDVRRQVMRRRLLFIKCPEQIVGVCREQRYGRHFLGKLWERCCLLDHRTDHNLSWVSP